MTTNQRDELLDLLFPFFAKGQVSARSQAADAILAAGFVKPSTVEFFARYEDGSRFGPSELDLRKVNPTPLQSPVKFVFIRHVTAWQPVESTED